jgi:hypothetical protein
MIKHFPWRSSLDLIFAPLFFPLNQSELSLGTITACSKNYGVNTYPQCQLREPNNQRADVIIVTLARHQPDIPSFCYVFIPACSCNFSACVALIAGSLFTI